MTTLLVSHAGRSYSVSTAGAIEIAIPLDFAGPQPNHFAARPATASPMEADGFVGDTRAGGSCNAEEYRLNPHCNGTHTECVGHVTVERVGVAETLGALLAPAALVSVTTMTSGNEASAVGAQSLAAALDSLELPPVPALVVRTQPNGPAKRIRRYTPEDPPAYFHPEAVAELVSRGVDHLLIDLPSLDPTHDGGRLAAHRAFWGLPPGSRRRDEALRAHATITEMVFVPDDVPDGLYLLDLQLPAFVADAAPSRPLLYPLVPR